MGYGSHSGKRPFERASKAIHSEIINNKVVSEFLATCSPPALVDSAEVLKDRIVKIPEPSGQIRAVIAIDGGMTETVVQGQFPSAALAFMTFGPLMLNLEDLEELARQPFIGPEDMAKLKNFSRYSLALPVRQIVKDGCNTFSESVRLTIQEFLCSNDRELMKAFRWLLFREWKDDAERESWEVPECPQPWCDAKRIRFETNGPDQVACPSCGSAVYLADSLRLYERIDDQHGAGSIQSYLLTTMEQLALVHLIKSVLDLKPSFLEEVLFIKDGPLAFFGVTAPLRTPMKELMGFLGKSGQERPLINLIGLEKSGAFVDHANMIHDKLGPGDMIILDNDYIYKYIVPGDPARQSYGQNTYYGSKVIFKGEGGYTYVATIPCSELKLMPCMDDFYNIGDVLNVTVRLRCSMYDNSLLPVALANRMVSLSDVPSSEILTKFAKDRMAT